MRSTRVGSMSGTRAKVRVAVVFGGRSAEHAISCVSAGSVIAALDPERYEVVRVGITPDGRWVLADENQSLAISDGRLPQVTGGTPVSLPGDPAGGGLAVDVVFPVLHGAYGEDGTIQGLLEMAGLPYVGSGVFASAASMDKEFTKKLLASSGLPQGDHVVLRDSLGAVCPDPGLLDDAARERLGLPVFVKPSRAGSSIGITKVTDWAQFADAVATAAAVDEKVVVEAAVPGREIECGVLAPRGGAGLPDASLPAEIRLRPGVDWSDFDAKYLDDSVDFDVPADLTPEQTALVQDTARRAYLALDCRGLARVDFFLGTAPDGSDHLVINEVNTMPGFTPISMFPRMWAATGVSYPELVDRLVASALGPRSPR
jgi:D-alanine-D-alanine ligase